MVSLLGDSCIIPVFNARFLLESEYSVEIADIWPKRIKVKCLYGIWPPPWRGRSGV